MKKALVLVSLLAWASAADAGQFVDVTASFVPPSMSGRDSFTYYCASCHGRTGRGDGPTASSLTREPADLTRLAANNGGTFPMTRIRRLVTHGAGDVTAHGTSEMPVWGPIFQALDASDTQAQERIENVLAFIQTLQKK